VDIDIPNKLCRCMQMYSVVIAFTRHRSTCTYALAYLGIQACLFLSLLSQIVLFPDLNTILFPAVYTKGKFIDGRIRDGASVNHPEVLE